MKRLTDIFLLFCLVLTAVSCKDSGEERSHVLKVYNWADYIDEDVLAEFPAWYKQQTGEDIRLIGITDISTLADYFLICTATSSTHVKTLCDAVEEAMDEAGEPMLSREGHRGGTWVLMDFGSLVVHVFTAEARKFYDLERLWQDGHQVNLAAVLGENA